MKKEYELTPPEHYSGNTTPLLAKPTFPMNYTFEVFEGDRCVLRMSGIKINSFKHLREYYDRVKFRHSSKRVKATREDDIDFIIESSIKYSVYKWRKHGLIPI